VQLQALAPLFIIIIPFLFVYSAASLYRSIYPADTIKRALETVAEYRTVKLEAERSKRKLKKVRQMEPQYKRAKRILLRASLVKSVILLVTYLLGSFLFLYTMPVLLSPYYIPVLTAITDTGSCVIYTFIIYFLSYILFFLLFRDSFL
jgi:hypothetical protein